MKSGKRNNKNKNKNKGGANKVKSGGPQSNGSWEEMLNKPLPEDDAAAQTQAPDLGLEESKSSQGTVPMTLGFVEPEGAITKTALDDGAASGEDEIDNDLTQATAASDAQEEEGGAQGGPKKKRKKRANKNQVAKLKAARRDFMNRCVSPSYELTKRCQLNGQVSLTNIRDVEFGSDAVYKNTRSGKNKEKKAPSCESQEETQSEQEDGASSDDEALEDYEIEGYHPCHIK